jgi:hypothetical protein
MNIDLYCNKNNFCCSYEYWHKIRNEIIKATFVYLYILTELNDIKKGTMEAKYTGIIKELISHVEKTAINNDYLSILTSHFKSIPTIDALIYFEVEGLSSLCNKSDKSGFYSVGDSYSICQLFKVIKPFLLKNIEFEDSQDNFIYKSVLELENFFQESINTKTMVTIC